MTDRRNTAARLLLEALRFRLEGRYLQSAFADGAWIDERSYARLAGE
jgi:RimJ/RimL family protein N-acetyltransferase